MNAIQFNNLNKTPVRTKSWLHINDISLNDLKIDKINEFNNVKISQEINGVNIQKIDKKKVLTLYKEFEYGVSKDLISQAEDTFNQGYLLTVGSNVKTDEPIIIEFGMDKNNSTLIDNLIIVGEENSKVKIIVKYKSLDESNGYHNGICTVYSKKNSQG